MCCTAIRALRTAPADNLPAQVEELLHHAATDEGPLPAHQLRAALRLVYLRPFTAGNGRMARLWQRRLLMDHWPVFGFLPVEAFVHRTEPAYHAALEYADRTGDCTGFLTYMLERIDEALVELLAMPDPVLSSAERGALPAPGSSACLPPKGLPHLLSRIEHRHRHQGPG